MFTVYSGQRPSTEAAGNNDDVYMQQVNAINRAKAVTQVRQEAGQEQEMWMGRLKADKGTAQTPYQALQPPVSKTMFTVYRASQRHQSSKSRHACHTGGEARARD